MKIEQGEGMARRRLGCLPVLLCVLAAVVVTVTVIVSFFAFRAYLFPQPFRPVTLTAREEAALQTKLKRLNVQVTSPSQQPDKPVLMLKGVTVETFRWKVKTSPFVHQTS